MASSIKRTALEQNASLRLFIFKFGWRNHRVYWPYINSQEHKKVATMTHFGEFCESVNHGKCGYANFFLSPLLLSSYEFSFKEKCKLRLWEP